MAEYLIQEKTLTDIADAIRLKTGGTEPINIDNFCSEIEQIESGGIDTSDATAIAGTIVKGETAYVNGEKITGTLEIQKYYTGSTEPDNTLGNDGDLYLEKG